MRPVCREGAALGKPHRRRLRPVCREGAATGWSGPGTQQGRALHSARGEARRAHGPRGACGPCERGAVKDAWKDDSDAALHLPRHVRQPAGPRVAERHLARRLQLQEGRAPRRRRLLRLRLLLLLLRILVLCRRLLLLLGRCRWWRLLRLISSAAVAGRALQPCREQVGRGGQVRERGQVRQDAVAARATAARRRRRRRRWIVGDTVELRARRHATACGVARERGDACVWRGGASEEHVCARDGREEESVAGATWSDTRQRVGVAGWCACVGSDVCTRGGAGI